MATGERATHGGFEAGAVVERVRVTEQIGGELDATERCAKCVCRFAFEAIDHAAHVADEQRRGLLVEPAQRAGANDGGDPLVAPGLCPLRGLVARCGTRIARDTALCSSTCCGVRRRVPERRECLDQRGPNVEAAQRIFEVAQVDGLAEAPVEEGLECEPCRCREHRHGEAPCHVAVGAFHAFAYARPERVEIGGAKRRAIGHHSASWVAGAPMDSASTARKRAAAGRTPTVSES